VCPRGEACWPEINQNSVPCVRYLEKRIGEHSGRQNLPEGWKWQKRWFVFTDTKGMLYYFKTADDPPNYRGVIDIKCVLVIFLCITGLAPNISKAGCAVRLLLSFSQVIAAPAAAR